MARNSFLSENELLKLQSELQTPRWDLGSPDGFGRILDNPFRGFSESLQQTLEKNLAGDPAWLRARPVRLGSWGRAQLAPQSDLDVLFLGPETDVKAVVGRLMEAGIRIRARTPVNRENLLEGVEPFDWLSLLDGRAWLASDQEIIDQQKRILKKSATLKRRLLKEIREDRKRRSAQYNSMRNRLEPQLKHSPGGLRDLTLALHLIELFPEIQNEEITEHARAVLKDAQEFFLHLRAELFFMGLQDQLIGTAQLELSHKNGFGSLKEFMREVNRRLDRGSFYSAWVIEWLGSSKIARGQIPVLGEAAESMSLLKKDSGILAQARVRFAMDRLFRRKVPAVLRGKMLWDAISYKAEPQLTEAVFQSRLIDKLCPDIRTLVGLVQHDQYHRWTAEAHLMKACLNIQGAFRKPAILFSLKKMAQELRPTEWVILSWTAFFHDIAKGRAGDHSVLGAEILRRELKAFGVPSEIREEVAFLVKHHLVISDVAFRKNPRDPETWKKILQLGFNRERILRLTIFTGLDIRATNEEAWNEWKSRLLFDAAASLTSPEKYEFQKTEKKLVQKFGQDFFASLDVELFREFSSPSLEKDWRKLQMVKSDGLSVEVLTDRRGHKWLRFHDRSDQLGQFENYVGKLYQAGISIQQALVQNIPGLGVYDLFQIPKRSWGNIPKLRSAVNREAGAALVADASRMRVRSEPPKIQLTKIEIVDQAEMEMVLSFKGTDARGLLWRIAYELQNQGFFILKARIHTWGNQIEDLISVKPDTRAPEKIRELKIALGLGPKV